MVRTLTVYLRDNMSFVDDPTNDYITAHERDYVESDDILMARYKVDDVARVTDPTGAELEQAIIWKEYRKEANSLVTLEYFASFLPE